MYNYIIYTNIQYIPNVNILRRFSMPIFFYTPVSSIYQYIIHIDDRVGKIGEIIFYSISTTFKYHFIELVVTSRLTLR